MYFISPNRIFDEPILLWQELQGNKRRRPRTQEPLAPRRVHHLGRLQMLSRALHGTPSVV